jgi:hypothetical protein
MLAWKNSGFSLDAAVQGAIRRRILRLFVRHGLVEAHDAKDTGAWPHAGGFPLDASVRIAAIEWRPWIDFCPTLPHVLSRVGLLPTSTLRLVSAIGAKIQSMSLCTMPGSHTLRNARLRTKRRSRAGSQKRV